MTHVFRLSHVTRRFGRVLALDDVSLHGERGQVVALLGENGAGKTTAIRILLGLETADSGESAALGMDSRVQGLEIRRRVGYVPDRPALYDWMTVAEIGWFTAGFYRAGYFDRYRQFVRDFRLPEDRRLKDLSRGMLAKVSLSLAMSHEPELLVLDEPTSGLDAVVRREFLESMIDVAATGRTVLLSSHQIAEVERVADVVAILREGRLIVFSELAELKQNVRELTVTLHDVSLTPPARAAAALLGAHRQDRQWRLLVRDERDELLPALAADPAIAHVESRAPSLEEIFVSLMHPAHRVSAGSPPTRSPAAGADVAAGEEVRS